MAELDAVRRPPAAAAFGCRSCWIVIVVAVIFAAIGGGLLAIAFDGAVVLLLLLLMWVLRALPDHEAAQVQGPRVTEAEHQDGLSERTVVDMERDAVGGAVGVDDALRVVHFAAASAASASAIATAFAAAKATTMSSGSAAKQPLPQAHWYWGHGVLHVHPLLLVVVPVAPPKVRRCLRLAAAVLVGRPERASTWVAHLVRCTDPSPLPRPPPHQVNLSTNHLFPCPAS